MMTRMGGIRNAAASLLRTTSGTPEEIAAAQCLKYKLMQCALNANDLNECLMAITALLDVAEQKS